jgi:hypothetical protein
MFKHFFLHRNVWAMAACAASRTPLGFARLTLRVRARFKADPCQPRWAETGQSPGKFTAFQAPQSVLNSAMRRRLRAGGRRGF